MICDMHYWCCLFSMWNHCSWADNWKNFDSRRSLGLLSINRQLLSAWRRRSLGRFIYLFVYLFLCVISNPVEVALDIDDCASFPCGVDNECIDEVNGYTCSCTTGYAPDNTSTQCIGLIQIAHCIFMFSSVVVFYSWNILLFWVDFILPNIWDLCI